MILDLLVLVEAEEEDLVVMEETVGVKLDVDILGCFDFISFICRFSVSGRQRVPACEGVVWYGQDQRRSDGYQVSGNKGERGRHFGRFLLYGGEVPVYVRGPGL